MNTLHLAIIKNKFSFSVQDDVDKYAARLKKEYGCDVKLDYFDSKIDLEWEPYSVGGLWGPKDFKAKLAAAQVLPPKHLYHDIFFAYDAAKYPEPGPLANWTYPHDFLGAAFHFIVLKKSWLHDDHFMKALWHETKHGFQRILFWRGKFFIDLTDGPGTEEDSDKRMVPLFKREIDTILLPPAGRIVPTDTSTTLLAQYRDLLIKLRDLLQKATAPQRSLLDALIQVESGGDDNAIGDLHLSNKAYGCLQIRKPYMDDVNEVAGTSYKAQDCFGNRKLSIWAFETYMARYARPERIGRPVTDQDRARIHNGGPDGYKKAATLGYWAKVKKLLP